MEAIQVPLDAGRSHLFHGQMTVKGSRWWQWDSPAGGPAATASRATRPTTSTSGAGNDRRAPSAPRRTPRTPGRTPRWPSGREGAVIPAAGKQLFAAYVLAQWLPHHQLEPGVRSEYARQIRKHLLPFFGPMKMRDIMPEQVRQWVTEMQGQGRLSPDHPVLQDVDPQRDLHHRARDEVVTVHPSRGVKTPPVPEKPRRIITADEFDSCTKRSRRGRPAAGGDRHRERPAVG